MARRGRMVQRPVITPTADQPEARANPRLLFFGTSSEC
jgi:hypothetical protein